MNIEVNDEFESVPVWLTNEEAQFSLYKRVLFFVKKKWRLKW